jgi:hypothetical protein
MEFLSNRDMKSYPAEGLPSVAAQRERTKQHAAEDGSFSIGHWNWFDLARPSIWLESVSQE